MMLGFNFANKDEKITTGAKISYWSSSVLMFICMMSKSFV